VTTPLDTGYGAHARTPEALDARERTEVTALRERQTHTRNSVAPGTPAAADLAARHEHERAGLAAKYEAERRGMERAQARAATVAATAAAQRDADLAPIKAERRRAFLLTHPDATDAAFERYWGRIADDEAATARERAVAVEAARLRASGQYSL